MRRSPAAAPSRSASGSSSRRSRSCRPRCSWARHCPSPRRGPATTPRSGARVGWLYAANTLGGVLGAVVAGFYLLRLYDAHVATYVAVALNLGVAAAASALARGHEPPRVAADAAAQVTPRARGVGPIYAATALSGMTALAAEVLWTRHLSLLLGGTVYTFALILAVSAARPRGRQRRGYRGRQACRPAQRIRVVPGAARRCDGGCGLRARAILAVLADRRGPCRWLQRSRCSSTCCASATSSCLLRCYGARAFRSRSPPRCNTARNRGAPSDGCTPRTRPARSSARC